MEGRRICCRCRQYLDLLNHYSRNKTGPGGYCERCYVCDIDKKLRTHYGITLADYDRMLEAQHGVCFVCHRVPKFAQRSRRLRRCPLEVDHDHVTGYVRGLLCRVCNFFNGYVKDDMAAWQRGVYYNAGNVTTDEQRLAITRSLLPHLQDDKMLILPSDT